MNKERFHNALALALGYKAIFNNTYNVAVDDNADEPKISITDIKGRVLSSFYASEAEEMKQKRLNSNREMSADYNFRIILDAVHQAYILATKRKF